jgi:DNA-binding GntR family transcriptional regulator
MRSDGASSLPKDGVRADRIYERLREGIVSGELIPGERLVERSLARMMGVSRTPVREALHRLEVRGFVQTTNRETVVAVHSQEDLHDLCIAREGMEGLTARLAAAGRGDLDLMTFDRIMAATELAVEANDVPKLVSLNHAFHEGVWIASRNRYLANELRLLRGLIERLQQTTLADPGRQHESVQEHRELLSALRERDCDAAEQITRRHFQTAMALRLANLGRDQDSPPDGQEVG